MTLSCNELRPWGYKTFFMPNSAEHEFCPANKSQPTNNYKFFLAKHSWAWKFSLLINMKMSTIIGIFVFISRENFMLSWVEHEKSFKTRAQVYFITWWCTKKGGWVANSVDPFRALVTHMCNNGLFLMLHHILIKLFHYSQPEGHLLADRYKSLQKRNIIEPRERAK